jgi:hypothetical protein
MLILANLLSFVVPENGASALKYAGILYVTCGF